MDEAAKGLIALGIAPGDKVCLWLNNCPEWVHLLFAVARIGAVLVPANTRFRTGDIEYLVRQGDCSTLITHDVSGPVDYLAMVRELVPESLAAPPAGPLRSERFPFLERIVTVSDGEHRGTTPLPALVEAGRAVSDAAPRRAGGGPGVGGRHPLHHVHVRDHRLSQGGDAKPPPPPQPVRPDGAARDYRVRRGAQLPPPLPHLRVRGRAAPLGDGGEPAGPHRPRSTPTSASASSRPSARPRCRDSTAT